MTARVVKTSGDGFHAVLARPAERLGAQSRKRAMAHEPEESGVQLRVRMGVHTGASEERDGELRYGGESCRCWVMAVAPAVRCWRHVRCTARG